MIEVVAVAPTQGPAGSPMSLVDDLRAVFGARGDASRQPCAPAGDSRELRGTSVLFAVQGTMPAATVPQTRHVSIQRALEEERVDLDAVVPEDVERRYGRLRRVPEEVANLDPLTRRRAVLDHLLDQTGAASYYMQVSAEDLPPYVWEWFSRAEAVVFVYTDPQTGREMQHVSSRSGQISPAPH